MAVEGGSHLLGRLYRHAEQSRALVRVRAPGARFVQSRARPRTQLAARQQVRACRPRDTATSQPTHVSAPACACSAPHEKALDSPQRRRAAPRVKCNVVCLRAAWPGRAAGSASEQQCARRRAVPRRTAAGIACTCAVHPPAPGSDCGCWPPRARRAAAAPRRAAPVGACDALAPG